MAGQPLEVYARVTGGSGPIAIRGRVATDSFPGTSGRRPMAMHWRLCGPVRMSHR